MLVHVGKRFDKSKCELYIFVRGYRIVREFFGFKGMFVYS